MRVSSPLSILVVFQKGLFVPSGQECRKNFPEKGSKSLQQKGSGKSHVLRLLETFRPFYGFFWGVGGGEKLLARRHGKTRLRLLGDFARILRANGRLEFKFGGLGRPTAKNLPYGVIGDILLRGSRQTRMPACQPRGRRV